MGRVGRGAGQCDRVCCSVHAQDQGEKKRADVAFRGMWMNAC